MIPLGEQREAITNLQDGLYHLMHLTKTPTLI
jgi:hypothetical protein